MKNIELHCHTSLKSLLSKGFTPQDTIEFKSHILGISEEVLGDVLDSQSSLEQLRRGKFGLVFWTIFPIEREMIQIKRIDQAMQNIKPAEMVNTEFIFGLRDGHANYFDVLQLEWKIMKEAVDAADDLKLISRIDQIDPSKINVFPNIEGAHSFINIPKNSDTEDTIDDGIYDRLRNFIHNNPLAYITLTHITNKKLFTHCYGLKMATKKELKDSDFFPAPMGPKGYSAEGEKILEVCLDENLPIDLKHMAVWGRLNIYDHLEKHKPGFPGVMCSHAGIAGIDTNDFLKHQLKNKKGNKILVNNNNHIVKLILNRKIGALGIGFNPQTISLYDDDIEAIISLGGIIGISLDQRILGARNIMDLLSVPHDYVTLHDFENLCNRYNVRPEDYLGENYIARLGEKLIPTEEEEKPRGPFDWERRHRMRFIQTIYHIVKVGARVTEKPWEHMALGSDYDGLVDAVNCCRTAAEIPQFREDIVKMMRKHQKNGKYKIPIAPEELLRLIFEVNVLDFYKRVEEYAASGSTTVPA